MSLGPLTQVNISINRVSSISVASTLLESSAETEVPPFDRNIDQSMGPFSVLINHQF